jgi:hypothetical protein
MVSLTGGDPVNSTVRPLQFMFRPGLSIVFMVLTVVVASAQTKTFVSPHDRIRALMVSVGPESRVEIRSFNGALLRRKNFTSRDQSHGETVAHAEWTADGHFFVFTTGSSGGHQPWHIPTYFYSVGRNRFYSVDSIVGAVLSDFALRRTVLSTTHMGVNADDPKPVTLSLNHWR